MARAVANLGHTVSIYTTNQDGADELDVPLNQPLMRDKVETRYLPIQSPRFWGTSLPLLRLLRRDVRGFDIVHIHSLYLFHDLVAGYYCRKYGVPYLISPHGALDPFIYRRHRIRKSIAEFLFENRNIQHAEAIHFTTREEMMLARPYTFNRLGLVVPLGLDLGEYEQLPPSGMFRSLYPQVGERKLILFLGRINFKKGLDILVEAFAGVRRERQDVHLVIAGPDNEGFGAHVRRWVNEAGVADRVLFPGMLTGEKKLMAMRDADLFVLASRSENFGIAVVEAMACGVPVVISNRVNIWREIHEENAGLVVPCDAQSFAVAIGKSLEDRTCASQMGEKGRALVRKRFQWSSIRTQLERAYEDILSGRACGICQDNNA